MEMGSLVPARGSRQVIGILRVDWGLVLISLIVDVIVRGPPAPATQAAGMFHLLRCWHWPQKRRNCMGCHPECDYMAVSQVFTSE